MGRREAGKRKEQDGKRQDNKRQPERMHPAGPHARPDLTDDDATPGTGALPDLSKNKDVDPGSE